MTLSFSLSFTTFGCFIYSFKEIYTTWVFWYSQKQIFYELSSTVCLYCFPVINHQVPSLPLAYHLGLPMTSSWLPTIFPMVFLDLLSLAFLLLTLAYLGLATGLSLTCPWLFLPPGFLLLSLASLSLSVRNPLLPCLALDPPYPPAHLQTHHNRRWATPNPSPQPTQTPLAPGPSQTPFSRVSSKLRRSRCSI